MIVGNLAGPPADWSYWGRCRSVLARFNSHGRSEIVIVGPAPLMTGLVDLDFVRLLGFGLGDRHREFAVAKRCFDCVGVEVCRQGHFVAE